MFCDFAFVSINGNVSSDTTSVQLEGTDPIVHVTGSITAGGNGIRAQGDNSRITISQSGSIAAEATGVRLGPSFTSGDDEIAHLTNAGTVTGALFGVGVITNAVINNTGVIAKSGPDVSLVGNAAITQFSALAKTLEINNSGQIIGAAYESLATLQPAEAIVLRQDVGNTLSLQNTGEIFGKITAAESADSIVNGGQIIGVVDLQAGAEVYRAVGTGVASETVLGGLGNDTLIGGEFGDDLDGGGDNDLVNGRTGNDILTAGAGNDTVLGGAGEDQLFGTSGSNILNGQGGDDRINGGSDNDRMLGGNGDDTLISGEGTDVLRGDSGRDVFVFGSIADTGTGSARDRILAWEDGADLIDLAGFGPLAVSASGAMGGGTASVWFQAVSGGAQTMLRIDADGDGSFDGQVLLVRADPALLDQNDLILG